MPLPAVSVAEEHAPRGVTRQLDAAETELDLRCRGEQATGMEPALSVWEAHQRLIRELLKCRKDQMNTFSHLAAAIRDCTLFLVACCRKMLSGEVLHAYLLRFRSRPMSRHPELPPGVLSSLSYLHCGRTCVANHGGPSAPRHAGSGTFKRLRPGRRRLHHPRITGWRFCACRRSSAVCIVVVISS